MILRFLFYILNVRTHRCIEKGLGLNLGPWKKGKVGDQVMSVLLLSHRRLMSESKREENNSDKKRKISENNKKN